MLKQLIVLKVAANLLGCVSVYRQSHPSLTPQTSAYTVLLHA